MHRKTQYMKVCNTTSPGKHTHTHESTNIIKKKQQRQLKTWSAKQNVIRTMYLLIYERFKERIYAQQNKQTKPNSSNKQCHSNIEIIYTFKKTYLETSKNLFIKYNHL